MLNVVTVNVAVLSVVAPWKGLPTVQDEMFYDIDTCAGKGCRQSEVSSFEKRRNYLEKVDF